MHEAPARVLQLGEPRLRRRSLAVDDITSPQVLLLMDRLQATLAAFRQAHGFGRAIAAPQIGVSLRFIAVDLGHAPFVVVNPEITWQSDETFTLWDDCMSFPSLLVKVRRHSSITMTYIDQQGNDREWSDLEPAHAELMQHEIDHLDGVLAIDRAESRTDLITREAYSSNSEHFAAQVDLERALVPGS